VRMKDSGGFNRDSPHDDDGPYGTTCPRNPAGFLGVMPII